MRFFITTSMFYMSWASSLFVVILILVLIKKLFPEKVEIKKSLKIIKWLVILVGLIHLFDFLKTVFYHESMDFLERAMGKYIFLYVLSLLTLMVLPLTLLAPKLAEKTYYFIFVSIAINFSSWFEMFVIQMTNVSRDFMEIARSLELFLIVFGKGIFLALVFLLLENFDKLLKRKRVKTYDDLIDQ